MASANDRRRLQADGRTPDRPEATCDASAPAPEAVAATEAQERPPPGGGARASSAGGSRVLRFPARGTTPEPGDVHRNMQAEPAIFDGHNDLLSHLHAEGGESAVDSVLEGRPGSVDAGKARAGGYGGGFFAIWVDGPSPKPFSYADMDAPPYSLPLPEAVGWDAAMRSTLAQANLLFELERRDALQICRAVADIRNSLANGRMAAVMHVEGAEAIDAELHALEVLHRAGLRSLGLTWSRNNAFACGVPFRFPSTPDIGPGLTDAGKRLVRGCNRLRILIDLSHLNEAGFWDVAALSDAPLVATHSNAHALCPASRNLTDRQLDAIRESDGMVGVNFAVAFLRDDGRMLADAPLELVMRQFDYLIDRLGEDRVGIGSDYDGAIVPDALATVADLPNLRRAMIERGYGELVVRKLCRDNWLRVLEKTWGSSPPFSTGGAAAGGSAIRAASGQRSGS